MNKKFLAFYILILTLIVILAFKFILERINLGFFLEINTKVDAFILIGSLISLIAM